MRLLLTIPLLLLLAAPARAGTYVDAGLDGWSPAVHAPGGFVAAGRGSATLGVQFWARAAFAPGDRAAWVYDAPADTSVAAWAFEREVAGIGGGDWNTLFSAGRLVAHDVPSVNRVWGRVAAGGLAAGRLAATLQCGGPHVCRPAGVARLTLRAPRVTLHDAFAPVASAVQGDLVTASVLRGRVALSFAAADRGGGVYRAFTVVDGRAGAPVAVGDERCRALAAYVFAHRRPCPLVAGATVTVDTARLAEGRHEVAVVVEDAAGNRATVYGPVTKTVDNVPAAAPGPAPSHPPAPSSPAPPPVAAPRTAVVSAWLERRGRRALSVTTRYGERVRLRGRVTAAGRPLASAPVDVSEQVVGSKRERVVAALRTLADGSFTAFTRVGPSRRIRVAGAPLSLRVGVRAPVSARIARGLVRGRVRGAGAGALVELQARRRGRWITRRVVRTFASGRFSGRLGARGLIRARVPAQPGLPYAAGVSPPRRAGRTAPRTSR